MSWLTGRLTFCAAWTSGTSNTEPRSSRALEGGARGWVRKWAAGGRAIQGLGKAGTLCTLFQILQSLTSTSIASAGMMVP